MKGGKTYRNELQDFVHEHYWRAQPQNGLPFDPVQWSNRKYRLQPKFSGKKKTQFKRHHYSR